MIYRECIICAKLNWSYAVHVFGRRLDQNQPLLYFLCKQVMRSVLKMLPQREIESVHDTYTYEIYQHRKLDFYGSFWLRSEQK